MTTLETKQKLEAGNTAWAEFIQFATNLNTFFQMVREFKGGGAITIVELENYFEQNIKSFAHLLTDQTKQIGTDYFTAFDEATQLAKLL